MGASVTHRSKWVNHNQFYFARRVIILFLSSHEFYQLIKTGMSATYPILQCTSMYRRTHEALSTYHWLTLLLVY